MQRWVALSFSLPRAVRHPLITRRVVPYGRHFHHVANLRTPDELDDELRDHLTEAYLGAGPVGGFVPGPDDGPVGGPGAGPDAAP